MTQPIKNKNRGLSFDKPLLDLAGNPLLNQDQNEVTLGLRLAPTLSGHNQGDPLKFFAWAVTIYNKGELVLDKSDLATLKDFVTSTLYLNNLEKAQILEVINNAV